MPRKSAQPSYCERDAAPGGVAAVDRALSLLAAFRADEEPLTLAQLANRTALHKSTALRLLASLEHAMLVERLADGRYALGRGVVRLHGVHQANTRLESVVMPVLRALVASTGESAALHGLWGSGAGAQRICLFRVDSPQPIRDHYKAGDIMPLSRGTGARVLVAFGDEASWSASQFDPKDLSRIRRQGYSALSGDRDPEVAGISAPVFKHEAGSSVLLGALVLSMPANRYTKSLIPTLVQAARDLSAALV